MRIRIATQADARTAADVVRRSVTTLCATDYHDDLAILARWLAAHTEADFRRWIASRDREVSLAANERGDVIGIGMVAWRGEIVLNFVAPEARFTGISKALMAHMEAALRHRGAAQAQLLSTQTAARFYRALGYAAEEERESIYGTLPVIAMRKRLR